MNDANQSVEAVVDALFQGRDSTIAKDLKLNMKHLLGESALTPTEAGPALLATATSLGYKALIEAGMSLSKASGLSDDEVREAGEAAAIMGMLNIYYRFRHMVEAEQGKDAVQARYRSTGLRMNGLAKPALGKERFEMLAFAVSVLNGCEMCINSHERELLKLGTSAEKLHDLARLAAVVKGAGTLLA